MILLVEGLVALVTAETFPPPLTIEFESLGAVPGALIEPAFGFPEEEEEEATAEEALAPPALPADAPVFGVTPV